MPNQQYQDSSKAPISCFFFFLLFVFFYFLFLFLPSKHFCAVIVMWVRDREMFQMTCTKLVIGYWSAFHCDICDDICFICLLHKLHVHGME